MDPAWKLENVFKLLFQEFNDHDPGEIISFLDSGLKTSELHENGCGTSNNLEKLLNSTELLLKIFSYNYETRFNIFIEYIFDQILLTLKSKIQNDILSTLPLNNIINVIDIILDISISHSCKGLMFKLAELYTYILNSVKVNNLSLSEEELMFRLRIISIFYEITNKEGTSCQIEDFKNLIANTNCEQNECDLYAKLVFNRSKVIVAQTLIYIIPIYTKFSGSNNILKYIWDKISKSLVQKNCEFSELFIVLCYLSDLYFCDDNKKLMCDIFKCDNYWTSLQKGLTHTDLCVRKQALFLLKKSCQYLNNGHGINLMSQNENFRDNSNIGRKCKLLLNYDSNGMIFDKFNELWCIIEYLEEKQIHLLKPMICMIGDIFADWEKLHISWILVIIQRMISHENMKIIGTGFSIMKSIPISKYDNEEMLRDAAIMLKCILNCTQLYSANWKKMVSQLEIFFLSCCNERNGEEFFKLLLCEISNERWSSEALFLVTYSLRCVDSKFLGRSELDLIKKILNGTVNHYTYIKSATQAQLLNMAINCLSNHVTLDDIADLIGLFTSKVCITSKSIAWEKMVKWIRTSYEIEDVEKFLNKSISDCDKSVNIGKMILILYDSYSDNSQITGKIKSLLHNILAKFSGVHVRPYFDIEAQEFYQSVICDIIKGSCGHCELLKIFSPSLPDILKYMELRLDSVNHISHFQTCQDLADMLDTVFKFSKEDSVTILEVISIWLEKIVKNLIIEPVEFLPLQKFAQIKTLTVIIVNNLCFLSHPNMKFIGSFIKSELCAPLEKTAGDLVLTQNLQKLWGKMNSEYLKLKWELLSYITNSPLDVLQVSKGEFLQLCLEALDIGSCAVLLPLINVLGKALPSLLSERQLRQVMDTILDVMMERKKNDDFYQLVQAYTEITFRTNVIETSEENIRGMILDHSKKLFPENNVNVANIFVKHVQNLEYSTESEYFFLDILPRALLLGQIQRKDELLISDICSLIDRNYENTLTNYFATSVEVRARAIQIVVSLDQKNKDHCEFAADLINALIKLEEKVTKNKTRYFADSLVHRCKERLIQSLLLLEGYISQDKSVELWKWVCNKIMVENDQLSVRYLHEWLIVRLMNHNSHLKDSLWKYFDQNIEKRPGSLCSLITIVYLSVKVVKRTEMEVWIEKAVRKFLPYCMAQHFSVRLYAQVTLQKLMNLTKSLNLIRIIEKYGDIGDILSESIESGNAVKVSKKIGKDFYFSAFDPVEHYTLETILYEIPRLTCVDFRELISPVMFEEYGLDKKNCSIPLTNENDSLKLFVHDKCIVNGSDQIDLFEDSEGNDKTEVGNLQKKMIPNKYLVPDVEDLLQFVSHRPNDKNSKEGLIVVGSLIDRLPNLGGLSRTCEVFGASEFVIGSLKYLEDQQFKSLSVTAEKWIPITEVKPYNLSDYLLKMKKNGYTILAAEQTVNSQPLGSVEFPKKSILLLGNEKEGIPPTLLPLMDVCVEIPQKGIIRSLNVHVTGALFIWEYAKQHNGLTNS